jgi:hypothetical protein
MYGLYDCSLELKLVFPSERKFCRDQRRIGWCMNRILSGLYETRLNPDQVLTMDRI